MPTIESSGSCVTSTDLYTVRSNLPCGASAPYDIVPAIVQAVDRGMRSLQLPGHLFVTLVDRDCIFRYETTPQFAVYHDGLRHITVAAAGPPDEMISMRDAWREAVQRSVLQCLLYYRQDLEGKLDGSIASEQEAERVAAGLLETL
jgi:hypothetical protein